MTKAKITYHIIADDCFSELSAALDMLAREAGDISMAEFVQDAKAELAYLRYRHGLVDNQGHGEIFISEN
jgi:alkyl hydroperoxide reductase subunit AhpC